MASLVINADADTYLQYNAPTTNYGSSNTNLLYGWDGANYTRMLLKAPLSSIPIQAKISAAILSIYNESTGAGTQNVTLYRVLKNWVEAQATWNIYSSGNNWASAGCNSAGVDRAVAAIGSLAINNTAEWKHISLDLTELALLRASNYGMVIVPADTVPRYIRTKEYASYIPYLTITYSMPVHTAAYLSDFGVI